MGEKVLWFKDCSYKNKALVGGKNSSLGELHRLSSQIHFNIADGFAITTCVYDKFLEENNLTERIARTLADICVEDIRQLEEDSSHIRDLITEAKFSEDDTRIILDNYDALCSLYDTPELAVAIRSSAIAEDLENASFAGQQDTYLNVSGHDDVIRAIQSCFASLFNSRAISYRKRYAIELDQVKISVAIQKMVRSDIGSAGVAFSIDTESGYDRAIVINSAFGLGELVVSGGVKPDEFILDKRVLRLASSDPILMKHMGNKDTKIIYDTTRTKEIDTTEKERNTFSMTNTQIVTLGNHVLSLEEKYSELFGKKLGVDIEWAIDGIDEQIYIIQTRPETVHSAGAHLEIDKYILDSEGSQDSEGSKSSEGSPGSVLLSGVAVGEKISTGCIKVLKSTHEFALFNPGDILVTEMTTPDWEPIMKISSGIITNKGGRTCHAAIVARELRLNALVGTGNATRVLFNKDPVTISCADGEVGHVYSGICKFHIDHISVNRDTKLPVKLMLNIGNPESSFSNTILPNQGVGLARLEFIISNYIKIHPLALCDYPKLEDPILLETIRRYIGDAENGKAYFIEQLARGMSKIASAFYPHDVIVRLSDFKSNEYRNLIGGDLYEPHEENPMIGWRGASRYYSAEYERAFALECMAIQYVRDVMKMDNVIVMIPFCRTPKECRRVLDTMEKYGLTRGVNGLQIYLMCEIPANVIEADNFSPMIDGVSIGGNDLLQLTLGVDRDSERITYLSDDKNVSYRRMIVQAIETYKRYGVKVGFCGQQPSDSIEFCKFLISSGIDSISVTPDSALKTIKNLG